MTESSSILGGEGVRGHEFKLAHFMNFHYHKMFLLFGVNTVRYIMSTNKEFFKPKVCGSRRALWTEKANPYPVYEFIILKTDFCCTALISATRATW